MNRNKQQGAVLVVAMLILVFLTTLTVSSAQTVLLQERAQSSVKDNEYSFALAEAAVYDAFTDLLSTPTFSESGSGGYWFIPDGYYIFSGKNQIVLDIPQDYFNDMFADSNHQVGNTELTCWGTNTSCKKSGKYVIIDENIEMDKVNSDGTVTTWNRYKIVSLGEGRLNTKTVIVVQAAMDLSSNVVKILSWDERFVNN